jgi:Tol biopolymer transport system component
MNSKLILIACAAIGLAVLISGCSNNKVGEEPLRSRVNSLPELADILFVSDRDTGTRRTEIYAMDIDTETVTRITSSEEHHFILGIDSSRQYIVASRAEKDTDKPEGLGNEDRRSLWVIDLRTKTETRLTDPRHHAEGDSFSPDSEWIVFHMKVSGEEQSDIYKIRRDGSELTQLTHTKTAVEGDPTFSHNGKEIAFVYLDENTKRFILKIMEADGSNSKTVYDSNSTVSTPVFPPGCYDPSWSPDDQWLVFEQCVQYSGENWGSGIWHIFVVNRNGTGLIDLSAAGTHTDCAEYLPSYSPDGKFIVFGSLYEAENPEESHNDIFIMDLAGNLNRVTDNPASDMYPVWIL